MRIALPPGRSPRVTIGLMLSIGLAVLSMELHAAERSHRGLVVFYDFSGDSVDTIVDRSGFGVPLNLKVEAPSHVERVDGQLTIKRGTIVRPSESADARVSSKLTKAIRRTNELTVEAWIATSSLDQSGPARIVTLSSNSSNRNFTLGQDSDKFDVRFRTAKTNSNGLPSLASKSGTARADLTHVVYTRDRRGVTRIYIDGKQNSQGRSVGKLSTWGSYRFALGNEQDGSRPWLGSFRLVALYNRAIAPSEVKAHFDAGAAATQPTWQLASTQANEKQLFFETQVAPLLANHCLECHDSATRQGALDLSKRVAAFQGGESGKVIHPGNSAASRLWETVSEDEMPADRPPLNDEQKAVLKKWLDDGAEWSLEQIDPAVYLHGEHETENWIRRLTKDEYVATINATFNIDISEDAERLLPAELRADGFSNTAYNLAVDLKHIEAYAKLADIVVRQIDINAFAKQFAPKGKFREKDVDDLIKRMGKRIFRGPIEEHERIAYMGIYTTVGSAGGDYEEVVRFLIEAMIQSPRFLYRVEQQTGDGQAYPVGDYELAARMSYTLWGAPPDAELIKRAESGALYEEAGLRREIARMLDAPQAREHSVRFISEWLNLPRLSSLRPNAERFPAWDPQLARDMHTETTEFFEEVVWEKNRPLSALLNHQATYLSPSLAKHYGLSWDSTDGEANSRGFKRFDLRQVPGRGGLLTQGSVLTVGGDDASMVTRGLLVMHELMRGVVKDPPPCVDTTPVASKPGLTQRAIAEARIGNSSCGGCHSKFEPLAFGLEKFDGIGGYHETDEHGNALRDDGRILFPGDAEPVAYQSSAEMMDLMAASYRVQQSLTWKVTQFAIGRPLGSSDAAVMAKIHEEAKRNGMTYRSLMTAIVASDLVQTIQTETEPNESN